jgi:hypothetical protein
VNIGEKQLKNIARPVRVYAVKTGAKMTPAQIAEAQRMASEWKRK